jgi:hypothetical protein
MPRYHRGTVSLNFGASKLRRRTLRLSRIFRCRLPITILCFYAMPDVDPVGSSSRPSIPPPGTNAGLTSWPMVKRPA